MDDAYRPLHDRGAARRADVLGKEYVERARERSKDFGADFQDVVTSVVWGGVWSRPGLALRERSLITVAVLTALGRSAELRLHLPGAVRNGCSVHELEEALIHVGAYAGFPTTVAANAVAQEVFGSRLPAEDKPGGDT
jgi:4-carboxymuconolactone decarboxylase